MSTSASSHQNPQARDSSSQKPKKMTNEDLLSAWDPDHPDKSVTELSLRTGRSEQEIRDALVKAALAAADKVAARWWKREGIILAFCALALIVVIALVLGALRTKTTVIAKHNLLPYQALTASDVEVARSIVAADGLSDTSQVEGRYLLKPTPAGKPILKSGLSEASLPDLGGRSIVEIPFKTGAVQPTLTPLCVSVLLISKTSGKEGPTAKGVWSLGVRQEKDMDWVAMAIPTAELVKMVGAMSGSDPILGFPATSSQECNFGFSGLQNSGGQSSATQPQAAKPSSPKK